MTTHPSTAEGHKREATHPSTLESSHKREVKASDKSVVVVELSSICSHEQVRRLRRGRGRLAIDIDEVIHELVQSGTIKPDAPPVVIVVRESTASLLWGGLEHVLDEDEEEDGDDDYDDEGEDDEDEEDDD